MTPQLKVDFERAGDVNAELAVTPSTPLVSRSSLVMYAWLVAFLLVFVGIPSLDIRISLRIVEAGAIAAALAAAWQRRLVRQVRPVMPVTVILVAFGAITVVSAAVGMIRQHAEPSPYTDILYGGTALGPLQMLLDQAAALAVFTLLSASTASSRAQTRAGFRFAFDAAAATVTLLAGMALAKDHSSGARLAAGFGNPNLFASFLLLCCPLFAAGVFSRTDSVSPLRRTIYLLLLTAVATELWFTGSRGAMIGAAVSLGLLAAMFLIRRSGAETPVGSNPNDDSFAATAGGGDSAGQSPAIARSTTRRPQMRAESILAAAVALTVSLGWVALRHGPLAAHGRSDQQRIVVWGAAMRITAAHPLTGVGLGGFASAMRDLGLREYDDATPSGLPMTPAVHLHAHDIFLQFAAERGIAGLVAITLLLGAIFARTLSPRNLRTLAAYTLAAGAALIGLTVQNLFDYTLWYAPLLLLTWALAGVLAARDGAPAPQSAPPPLKPV